MDLTTGTDAGVAPAWDVACGIEMQKLKLPGLWRLESFN